MNNLFYHQDVRGVSLFGIMPWDLDKTSGLQDPNSYCSRQDTDLSPQFGLGSHALAGARPPAEIKLWYNTIYLHGIIYSISNLIRKFEIKHLAAPFVQIE